MKGNIKYNKVKFLKSKNLGYRNWGTETLLALIPKKLSLKILKIKKGKSGGLQYHNKKNECGYILKGKLLIRFDEKKNSGKLKERILKAGDVFHFPPKSVHQEKAITECIIIEASTPHFNDRVRVEKYYGKFEKKGLPSTKISEILFK
jgi:mannose-6-phosphate isomerase-like protein (cupin superfamily)